MLTIQNLDFNYNTSTKKAIDNITFQVEIGEVISIIGESGSGKSTLLKLIYGLEDFDQGEIKWNDKKLRGPSFNILPGHKMMKYVAQDYDLLDVVTVGENVGKFLSNFDLDFKNEKIEEALAVVEMLEFKDKLPSKLSGGQRQRVSIARALAQKPEVLLLDEPFSNIDQSLKISIREKIVKWCKEHRITVIFTTHDLSDAFYTSDRILVLQNGKKVQYNMVEKVRENPANSYVAKLFGYVNLLKVGVFTNLKLNPIDEDNYYHLVYPDEVWIDTDTAFQGIVEDCKFQGRDYLLTFKSEGQSIVSYFPFRLNKGDLVKFSIPTKRIIKA